MSVRLDATTDRPSYTGGAPDPDADFTFACWALVAVDQANAQTIVRLWDGGTVVTVATGDDGLSGPNYFTVGSSITSATTGFAVGEWRKVAVSCAGGTAGAVYVSTPDGPTEVRTGAVTTPGPPGSITLGGRSTTDDSEWWNGRLAYVRLWDAVLTQSEIEAEWASDEPVRTADLWADWPLETADDLTDHSGNGRHLSAGTTALTTEDGPPLPEPVPQLATTLPIVVGLASTLDAPAATVPQLSASLSLSVALAAEVDTPPATVAALATSLPLTVGLAGELDVPAPSVPTLAAVLPVALTFGGVLDTPAAAVPEIAATLPLSLTLTGQLDDLTERDITVSAAFAASRWTANLGASMTNPTATLAAREVYRHSEEHVAIDIAVNGTPITAGFTYLVLPFPEEPASRDEITGTPTVLSGKPGFMVGPDTANELPPGEYHAFVRYPDDPEDVVLPVAGVLKITRGVAL